MYSDCPERANFTLGTLDEYKLILANMWRQNVRVRVSATSNDAGERYSDE